jgi:hypothetical protein
MDCPERERLEKEYVAATRVYCETVRSVHSRMGTIPKHEFDLLNHDIDQTRLTSEMARLDLERHVSDHRCRNSC